MEGKGLKVLSEAEWWSTTHAKWSKMVKTLIETVKDAVIEEILVDC